MESTTSPANPKPGIVYSTMGEFDIRGHYRNLLLEDPTKSMPIAAIESLSALCDATKARTIHELMSTINEGAEVLKASVPNSISLTAGCDLFKRYIIAHAHDDPKNFEAFVEHLQVNGHLFAHQARASRSMVAEIGSGLVKDGMTVLIHGDSRCVTGVLLKAAEKRVNFKVICTETRPSMKGLAAAKILKEAGIPVAVVDDNAVGYVMLKVNMVMVGAEGTLADASIINIMGTHQLAVVAQKYKRPFYVATETHKFVDLFPLNQFRLPIKQDIMNFNTDVEKNSMAQEEFDFVDYTDRNFITKFITEVGVKTPSSVADEILRLRLS
ncbi:Translation initiation factor [Rhizina undulata]